MILARQLRRRNGTSIEQSLSFFRRRPRPKRFTCTGRQTATAASFGVTHFFIPPPCCKIASSRESSGVKQARQFFIHPALGNHFVSLRGLVLCCTISTHSEYLSESQCYISCIKVESMHALCFDFVEVKGQSSSTGYIYRTPASITGTLHHKAKSESSALSWGYI